MTRQGKGRFKAVWQPQCVLFAGCPGARHQPAPTAAGELELGSPHRWVLGAGAEDMAGACPGGPTATPCHELDAFFFNRAAVFLDVSPK